MKVSLNWVKEYTKLDLSVAEVVDRIGKQLGAIEAITDLGDIYRHAIIVRVISCQNIPGTHLKLCRIDDNKRVVKVDRDKSGYVQVVCGADNVREGFVGVWLPLETIVPSSLNSEPLTLEAREIRGHISNGMLASAHELALSSDHSGILEINPVDAKPGEYFADVYKLDDHIIDIENKMFTHRPDCFGELGVAREIAGICHVQFTSPDWYLKPLDIKVSSEIKVEIDNQVPKLVRRFMAVAISGLDGGQSSPLWLQTYLSRVGVRPINIIVDIANYMMMLTGQPLHAYDLDKLLKLDDSSTAKLVVRHPKEREKLTLLDGKEICPGPKDIVIASRDKLIGLAGIKGGKETEVSEGTKNILLECANFDMYAVRRTGMSLGQFSDAFTRFTKGQSPLQNDRVLAKTADMICQLANGKVSSQIIDDNPAGLSDSERPDVKVSVEFINSRLGLKLGANDIKQLLTNVEFEVDVHDDRLHIKAPFWRQDIEIAEDIVEEVGRLYGYSKLPLQLPKRDIGPAKINRPGLVKSKIRQILASGGANELLTYSFIHQKLIATSGQNKDSAFRIANALSPDLQYYRLSLLPSLLDKVHQNIKAGAKEFSIFEINPVHVKGNEDTEDSNLPKEFPRLSLVFAAEDKLAKSKYTGAPYYQALNYLDYLMDKLSVVYSVQEFDEKEIPKNMIELAKTFEPKRSALISIKDNIVGLVGEPKLGVKKGLKLPDYVSMFELDLTLVINSLPKSTYQELSHYPKVEQDICLRVKEDISYRQVYNQAHSVIQENVGNSGYFSLMPIDIYVSPKDESHKQITLRLSVSSYQKTMTDSEVSSILKDVSDKAAEKLEASVV
jgi:phenylalanyl-tRNA synthetase beta chain